MNDQINAEIWSAYLYLSMSMDAENKGFRGVANWFYIQFKEEMDHARIFMNYLNSRDCKVELAPVAEVPTSWETVLDMFVQTLEHEKKGTSLKTRMAYLCLTRSLTAAHTPHPRPSHRRIDTFKFLDTEKDSAPLPALQSPF